MSAIVSNFRRWWRPPRRAQAREEDRTVTFLELFYDLILTFLWWRTGVHDPNHRPLSRVYSAVFFVTTLLPLYRTGRRITLISALVILLLGLSGLSTMPFLLVLLVFMLSPVFYGVKVWITALGAEEMPVT